MMEIVPTLVNGGVVLDVMNICSYHGSDCKTCPDQAVGIHNWLLATGLRYVVVDFQDEKEVCPTILIELLQLRKRLGIPFIFVGMMDRPKSLLLSYAYSGYPFFATPEEAMAHLQQMHPDLIEVDFTLVQFGTPIPCSRARQLRSSDEEGAAQGEEDEEMEDASI